MAYPELVRDLPSGTVTFLLTDVEGSTRLWEEDPAAMGEALARHDTIVGAAVEGAGGTVLKSRGEGDSVFAAFGRAGDAVIAALQVQRDVHAERWPAGASLRVRVAVHTGDAAPREGDYFGTPVNRCARLRSAGHGGQTLVSQATFELVRDDLPAGSGLRDLGPHRLKDLSRPERIYQLEHTELPRDFPPLRTIDARPHNLPVQPTPLVGRELDVRRAVELLKREDIRMLTITGPGGVGKTRLALQVGAELLDRFEDGVWFVSLAAVFEPALVAAAIAQTMGVREREGTSIEMALIEFLRDRSAVLVLDNFEHVIDAAAFVGGLPASCPGLKIIVTSREALRVGGEQRLPLAPLSVPDIGRLPPADQISQYDAVDLFIRRARAVDPDFGVTNDNAAAVAGICARLDGLPLAIELAAARIRLFGPQAMLDRLSSRLALAGGGRDVPERHQTLRAAIAWSYDLLGEEEKLLMRRLSVFSGGFELEGAEAVCGGAHPDLLDGVTALLDRSLLRRDEESSRPRFSMLETIREFGYERLEEAGETGQYSMRHARWFMDLARRASPELKGPSQAEWLDRLGDEHSNLTGALRATVEAAPDESLRLATALGAYWTGRGHLSEGRGWLERALLSAPPAPESLRSDAVRLVGALAWAQGDYAVARRRYGESLELCRELGDRRGTADNLNNLSVLAAMAGDLPEARRLCEESLSTHRELGDRRGEAQVLSNLGAFAFQRGDRADASVLYEQALAIDRERGDGRAVADRLNNLGVLAVHSGDAIRARAMYEESLALRRELGHRVGIAETLNNLGELLVQEGDLGAARPLFEESLALAREVGDRHGEGVALHNLADVSCRAGDLRAARAHGEESLSVVRELRDRWLLAAILESFARIVRAENEPARAARLFGAAEALRETIGAPLTPSERSVYDREVELLREALVLAGFADAWAAGRALDPEEAALEALAPSAETAPVAVRAPGPHVFRREGDYWTITFERDVIRLRDAKGLRYLAMLIRHPNREFHVLDLLAAERGPVEGSRSTDGTEGLRAEGGAGEIFDSQARSAYRQRLKDLQDELDEARSWNDTERAARLGAEVEFLMGQLAAGLGLGGRRRAAPSAAEQARMNVARVIKASLRRIEADHPGLGRHLAATIRTGMFCSYMPDPRSPVVWTT